MATLTPWFYQQFFDPTNGNTALTGGKVFFYEAGTTTKKDAYKDSSGSVAHSNPMILDSNGFPPNGSMIFLGTGSYKIVVAPADDSDPPVSAIKTIDNISAGINGESSSTIVNTISALRQLTAGAFDYAWVIGYYAITDTIKPRLYRWDSSSTSTDDGGGIIKITATTTGRWKLVCGKEIDIKWFGATGDGSTNDYTEISKANTFLVSLGGGVLTFSAGTYNITSALTLPDTVDYNPLPGAYLKSSNGSNTTINKLSSAGLSKRFDTTLGTITFGTAVSEVYPEWFGATGDGTTDDSGAIQKAFTSHKVIKFPQANTYKITTGLTLPVNRIVNFNGATLSPNANSITIITPATNSANNTNSELHGLRITNAASKTGCTGVLASGVDGLVMTNYYIEGVESGLPLAGARNQTHNNGYIKSCTGGGLKLTASVGAGDAYNCTFNNITLDSNACGLFAVNTASTFKNIVFNGLNLTGNTVNGAYFNAIDGISITGLRTSGNGTGSATVTIDTKTVYKSDLYLDSSVVEVNDSDSASTLNNSIQLVTSSTLIRNNCVGYASTTNTEVLCDATSKFYENGLTTATGYREGLKSYGQIKNIVHPYMCHGVGKSIRVLGKTFFAGAVPQYPDPTTSAPASESHTKTDKNLTRVITFAGSIGSEGTNSIDVSMGTGMSGSYQISTALIRCSAGSKTLTIKWKDNSSSYSHDITLNSDQDDWRRLVFITAGKTSHNLVIFPPNTAGSTMYITDCMCWDGSLEAISNIYNSCIVGVKTYDDYDSAAPTAGTWAVADKVWYNGVTAVSHSLWICTTAGTPGTWTTF